MAVSFSLLILTFLAPTLLFAKMQVATIAQNAARTAAITQSISAVQQEITQDLASANLPVTWDGQTLFTVQNVQSGTGYNVQTGSQTPEATVSITYNVPLPFDRAFTLIGGQPLAATIPIQETATYYNETQYTGDGE